MMAFCRHAVARAVTMPSSCRHVSIRVVVHVDYEKHRLVMIDLGDNVVVYVDYAEHLLVVIDV